METKSSNIKVNNLVKKFGETTALENINLDIQQGEFFALLGPSGCGKTTTMRCVAGFENPTSGEMYIGGELVNNKPANKRDSAMVFQSYALFPHYNVFQNVAFSLNIKELKHRSVMRRVKAFSRLISKKLSKTPQEIQDKVYEILDYVELKEYADRATNELSGGQQQRVALARALVMEPTVLLLDEPLSNLDKKLREDMRDTIRKIQLDLGITTIFVTHDQEEAMSMADRIAVMKDGVIQQIGTPTSLYSEPENSFIASFVGSSNILEGENLSQNNGYATIQADGLRLIAKTDKTKEDVTIVFRPENIEINTEGFEEDTNVFDGKITLATYLGSTVRYTVSVGGQEVIVDTTYEIGEKVLQEGSSVKVKFGADKAVVL